MHASISTDGNYIKSHDNGSIYVSCTSAGLWEMESSCKDLQNASSVLRQLDNKLGNTLMEDFNNKIRSLENQVTTMKETISIDNSVHFREFDELATAIDNCTGHLENQNKVIQSIESKTGSMAAPLENLNTAVYSLETLMTELLNKTRHKEIKDCSNEMGKDFISA